MARPEDAAGAEALRTRVVAALRPGTRSTASSTAILRVSLELEPASLDAGETTDKGYLNQRRVLKRRAATVARLFAEPPDAGVLVIA